MLFLTGYILISNLNGSRLERNVFSVRCAASRLQRRRQK